MPAPASPMPFLPPVRSRTRAQADLARTHRLVCADDGLDVVLIEDESQGTPRRRKDDSSVLQPWVRPAAPADCPICLCEFAVDEGVCLTACSHAFCQECISTYVEKKAKDGEVLEEQMCCPHTEPSPCALPLAPQDVLRCLADPAERQRYERLTLQRCVESGKDMACCPTGA